MNRSPKPAAGLPRFVKFGIATLLIAAPIAAAGSLRSLYRQASWSRDLDAIPLQAESRVVGRIGNLRIVSHPDRPVRQVGSEAVVSALVPAWVPLADNCSRLCPGRPMAALLSYTTARDADLELLERAPDLHVVELDGTFVTDEGIRRLCSLKKLYRLSLAHTAITDASLQSLADLRSLKALDLVGTSITSVGLRFLSRLPDLETLDLSDTHVSGGGLIELRSLAHIETLALDHLDIDDADLDILCELPTLQNVSFVSTRITDAGLLKLASLPSLRTVSVARTRVTDAGILHFETVRRHSTTVLR